MRDYPHQRYQYALNQTQIRRMKCSINHPDQLENICWIMHVIVPRRCIDFAEEQESTVKFCAALA